VFLELLGWISKSGSQPKPGTAVRTLCLFVISLSIKNLAICRADEQFMFRAPSFVHCLLQRDLVRFHAWLAMLRRRPKKRWTSLTFLWLVVAFFVRRDPTAAGAVNSTNVKTQNGRRV